ncbi:Beta-1,3-glucosyltransferase [Vibrio chagasii]|nr:Beta-1,3-glucosyltransferase [Vibrio chagasii]
MKLSMLYSVYDNGIIGLPERLPKQHEMVEIVIVHQSNNHGEYSSIISSLNARKDVKYTSSSDVGVTKSRNLAIKIASGDIVVFCDDDVVYTEELYSTIKQAYHDYPTFDFITFAYSSKGEIKGKFSSTSRKHSKSSILSVGTIEVTSRRDLIINNKITFPEDMGAGAKYFLCDEPVFLSRLMKNNMKGLYIPIVICEHPEESSGAVFNDRNAFVSRLLCFQRIFGNVGGRFLYLVFLIKNWKKFSSLHYLFIGLSRSFINLKKL